MLFENLKEYSRLFPKFKKLYQLKSREGYSIAHILMSTTSPKQPFQTKSIEFIMEHNNGDRILLSSHEFRGEDEKVSVENVSSTKEKLHENLLLTKESIHFKEFKRKWFGGYDEDEVNAFLDMIVKDYRFVEKELLKEIRMLNEDIEKLRR